MNTKNIIGKIGKKFRHTDASSIPTMHDVTVKDFNVELPFILIRFENGEEFWVHESFLLKCVEI